MKIRTLIITFFVLLVAASHLQAETVHISVAASMTDAFKEIISQFSKEQPEAKVLPNFASSGSLAKQINQGAPADFYVSANPKWMKFLIENKVIAEGTDRVFAYNKLVFVGASSTKATDLSALSTLTRIAIGSPKSVPAGQYAKEAMEAAGIYSNLEHNRQLVMAKDVRQALLYADRGEVAGAFVYRTDAMLAKNASILFTVPDNLYDRVAYPLALTAMGARKEVAKSFYDFMSTPAVITILKKYGFEPVQ